jgi:dipeptidyl aminopeptidase/acylaminoacyl peptidase
MATTVPYGHWTSPLGADDVARAKVSLYEPCSDGVALYWLESRPEEAGRVVMVRSAHGATADHSPPGLSIRSRVNEYGGGAMTLVPGPDDGAFAYVDYSDQRVWFCPGASTSGARPRPLTPSPPDGERHQHGGLSATPDGDWVLAVREVHRTGGSRPERMVVAVSTRTEEPNECTLLDGHDFFGTARVHPAGDRLAVVTWDHPAMPWDASTLQVLPLASDGRTNSGSPSLVPAGRPWSLAVGADESVGQPVWQLDGTLRFVSDRSGWWQPYLHPGVVDGVAEALTDVEAEFHGPDWNLGQVTMAELPDGGIAARMTADGRDALVTLRAGEAPRVLAQPCVSIAALCAHREGVAMIGSSADAPTTIWVWEPDAGARPARPSVGGAPARSDVAGGEPFSLTGRAGRPVYGTLYRPHRSGVHGPNDTRPPLIVWCHGGPTGSCQAGLDLTLQFFTTRGFAVACVDYAGSTGYGRAYRCALWGLWGVADPEDCLDAALRLAARGDVDPQRMAVRGGSAGGMTALNALAAGEGFGACVSWYGVTDLMDLVATTHDFEAHYTDTLIGPLPESRALYEERSPVSRAPAMAGSVLLLQGTEDAVVPPAQAERMRDALVAAGTHCDLRFFEGEGHGFRRADTLTACLAAELEFYLAELEL